MKEPLGVVYSENLGDSSSESSNASSGENAHINRQLAEGWYLTHILACKLPAELNDGLWFYYPYGINHIISRGCNFKYIQSGQWREYYKAGD